MTAVAEVLEPPELFAWFQEKREAIGIHVEPLDDHAGHRAALDAARWGRRWTSVRSRHSRKRRSRSSSLVERVAMPAGPATLALRTGATLVAAACYTGPGRDHFAVVSAAH